MSGFVWARWVQVCLGIVCMIAIANLQFGWSAFVGPIDAVHHWGRPAIETVFTIFLVAQAWLMPLQGAIADRFGVRATVLAGGAMIGASWLLNGFADSLLAFYALAVGGGIGAGLVYSAVVANALRWFPNRRGLAAGLAAAGYGVGTVVTVLPITDWIAAEGYQSTFVVFGAVQGAVVMLVSMALGEPDEPQGAIPFTPGQPAAPAAREWAPLDMLRTPVFWLMYAMFLLAGLGTLMASAQVALAAAHRAGPSTVMLGLTLPVLSVAVSLSRSLAGIARPVFGWLSDQVGREEALAAGFALEAACILLLLIHSRSPLAGLVLTGLAFFAGGAGYGVFPATIADTFGTRRIATCYGLLYTARGTAALLLPLTFLLRGATGSWAAVLITAACANGLAAVLALAALRPRRRRLLALASAPADGTVWRTDARTLRGPV